MLDLLWTDFLNSDWHDWRGSGQSEDRLDKPAWLAEFLAQWNFTAEMAPVPAAVSALKELRTLLHRMAEAVVAGAAPSAEDLARLNGVMAGGPLVRQVAETDAGHGLDLIPVRQDWPYVMAEVAASFAQTLTEGEGGRIRICANPDCLWVFYDDTRNRNKRFCDDKSCGNLMKVRRFRARNKSTPGESASETEDDS